MQFSGVYIFGEYVKRLVSRPSTSLIPSPSVLCQNALHEKLAKLDLHQIYSVQIWIWCKTLQAKVKSTAKMANTAFSHKFTTPCKLKQMRHLPRRRFPPRFPFFAPNLPRANLCKSNFSCSDERGRNVIMLVILLYSEFWLAESQFARSPEPPVNDSILSFSWFVNILILKTCKRKKKLFFLYGRKGEKNL